MNAPAVRPNPAWSACGDAALGGLSRLVVVAKHQLPVRQTHACPREGPRKARAVGLVHDLPEQRLTSLDVAAVDHRRSQGELRLELLLSRAHGLRRFQSARRQLPRTLELIHAR